MARKRILKVLDVGTRDKRTKTTTQKAVKVLDQFAPSVVAQKMGISTQKLTAIKKQVKAGKLYSPELRDFFVKIGNKLLGVKSKEEIEFEKFLKDAGLTKKEFKKQQKELEKRELEDNRKGIISTPGGVAEGKTKKEKRIQYRGGDKKKKEGGVYYYKYHEDLLKDAPESKVVKTVGDYKQARAWWGEIGGGNMYFVITRVKATGKGNEGKFKFQVVDIRTNEERAVKSRGKLSGAAKARQEIERAEEVYENYKKSKKSKE